MKYLIPLLLLAGCATQTATPIGNDMMQIDVSAPPIYGRAGAQRIAFEKAAEATLAAGYDRFIVLGNQAWNEGSASGYSYGGLYANQNSFYGSSGSGWQTMRNPESSMVIKMFKNSDKGASKAVDARSYVNK